MRGVPDDDKQSAPLSGARYLGFGFEFAATIVAGVLIGNYLDQWLGTGPLFTLAVTLGAMVGAVQRLISSLRKHSSH